MQRAVYAPLGVFLLLAVRDLAAYRGVIAFVAWSSLAHASRTRHDGGARARDALSEGGLHRRLSHSVLIGATLLALLPRRAIGNASWPPEAARALVMLG
jgi:hypothetical protein